MHKQVQVCCCEAESRCHNLRRLHHVSQTLTVSSWPAVQATPVPVFRLAASATPKSSEHVAALRNAGINHVYTLTEEEPLPGSWFSLEGPNHTFSPVPDGRAPTFAQVTSVLMIWMSQCLNAIVSCLKQASTSGSFYARSRIATPLPQCKPKDRCSQNHISAVTLHFG